MEKTPHIAILPSPGMGHLIPMAEFAKQLVQHHRISATIIIPTTGPPPKLQTSILESLPENIHHIFLPPVSGIPPGTRMEVQLFLIIQASLSSIRDALSSLKSRTHLVALVFDMFGHDSIEVAQEFNLFKFLFFPTSAMALSFTFILPNLDEETSCEYKDLPYQVHVPGSVSFHGRDLMSPVQIRTDEAYKGYLRFSKRLTLLDGILVNSFQELEAETFRVLTTGESQTPIYPIGPLIRSDPSNGSDRHESLKWLDHQPTKSVVLVSFGSGGTLSLDQVHELAKGLETSGQRFLWIIKNPNDKASNASFFTASSQTDSLGFLPQGFLTRTKNQGLVVTSWAPQIEILSHDATGGFLTHCGWNSVLESVVHGIPMIAWPLYAEQHMNAKVMTESLWLALQAETDDHGIVRKEVIEKVVKDLMVGDGGKKISKRLSELKVAAMKALSDEGSSMESLSKFAVQLINK